MFEVKKESYDSRRGFERNAMLLSERMSIGRFKVTFKSSYLIKGLQEARVLPNGRINLLTINESVRATMHMMGHKHNISRDEEEE